MPRKNSRCLRLIGLTAFMASMPVVAQTAPARPADKPDDAVVLSPFQVSADANDAYEATNTNSLTGVNASLNETPVDARIMTKTMIEELGGGDVFKLLGDFGGLGAMLSGGGSEDQRGLQPGDQIQPEGLTGRGFGIGTPRRDGFLRSATSLMSSFDVESADVINGSNNLLYGSGDASGVVVVNSKRGLLNRRVATLRTKADSEGSLVHSFDGNYGNRTIGVRLNLLKSAMRYYRPLLTTDEEGLQTSLTYRPFRSLTLYGDYRHYQRGAATSRAGVLRVPTTDNLILSTGENLDNQSTDYLVGVGGTALLKGLVGFHNNDSVFGAMSRQHWVNETSSFTADYAPSPHFAAQVKYGRDTRVNATIVPSSTTFYSPDNPANGYIDENGNHQWAVNMSLTSQPFITGAEGVRGTMVGNWDLGRILGIQRPNIFYSDQTTWTFSRSARFYEVDDAGNFVINPARITNADGGRNPIPAVWEPMFSGALPYGLHEWPAHDITLNGKRYVFSTQSAPDVVPKTPTNPYGLSGPVDASGRPTNASTYQLDQTIERGFGGSLASKFWNGHIDTLLSYRRENATSQRLTTAESKGPITYDSKAYGFVADTPIRGLRVYANRSKNHKIAFNTSRDINNELLPIGEGQSDDVGLKLSLWQNRLSGSITYYKTEQLNNAGSLGGNRDNIDPDGINGRHGGSGYVFSRESDGLSIAVSARPTKAWTLVFNLTQANGSERGDTVFPIFYNDQFNTMTLNGQPVVAIKTGTAATPLMVPSDPKNAGSPTVPLSIAMMKDPKSPYFANLDPESGQILNSDLLNLRTPGVGTGVTGLPISEHQLGFAPPSPVIVVRKAGEPTTGYAENAFSLINRYQFDDGMLRGLVLGMGTIYQTRFRAYRYTDASDGGARKTFYYPDRFENNFFAIYSFKATARTKMTLQLNVDNVFNRQRVIALPRSTNGTIRYYRLQYVPRLYTLALSVTF